MFRHIVILARCLARLNLPALKQFVLGGAAGVPYVFYAVLRLPPSRYAVKRRGLLPCPTCLSSRLFVIQYMNRTYAVNLCDMHGVQAMIGSIRNISRHRLVRGHSQVALCCKSRLVPRSQKDPRSCLELSEVWIPKWILFYSKFVIYHPLALRME